MTDTLEVTNQEPEKAIAKTFSEAINGAEIGSDIELIPEYQVIYTPNIEEGQWSPVNYGTGNGYVTFKEGLNYVASGFIYHLVKNASFMKAFKTEGSYTDPPLTLEPPLAPPTITSVTINQETGEGSLTFEPSPNSKTHSGHYKKIGDAQAFGYATEITESPISFNVNEANRNQDLRFFLHAEPVIGYEMSQNSEYLYRAQDETPTLPKLQTPLIDQVVYTEPTATVSFRGVPNAQTYSLSYSIDGESKVAVSGVFTSSPASFDVPEFISDLEVFLVAKNPEYTDSDAGIETYTVG